MQLVQLDNTIDQLNELDNSGVMANLIKKGLMPAHIYTWLEIHKAYLIDLEKTKSKLQAMENVAFEFNISFELVRHIRRKLE